MQLALGVWGSKERPGPGGSVSPLLPSSVQACTLSPRPSKQEKGLSTGQTLETGPRSNNVISIEHRRRAPARYIVLRSRRNGLTLTRCTKICHVSPVT